MTHWWFFAPVAMFTVFAGYIALRFGQPVSETQIITHYAQLYVAEAGGAAQMQDCLAVPVAQVDVRLVVICTHPGGAVFRYPVDARGNLRAPLGVEEAA